MLPMESIIRVITEKAGMVDYCMSTYKGGVDNDDVICAMYSLYSYVYSDGVLGVLLAENIDLYKKIFRRVEMTMDGLEGVAGCEELLKLLKGLHGEMEWKELMRACDEVGG